MRRNILILLCFVFLSLFCTVQSICAQKNLLSVVNKYIGEQEDSIQASEPPKTRKVIQADLDGDGDKDAVVKYMLEGFGGGNNWAQMLAVFRNDKGVYKFVTEDSIGGKLLEKSFTLKKVVNRKIYLDILFCPEISQGICENPKKGRAAFVFRKGKLQKLQI